MITDIIAVPKISQILGTALLNCYLFTYSHFATPISPTPVSSTYDQQVAFRLLVKKIILFGHQSNIMK